MLKVAFLSKCRVWVLIRYANVCMMSSENNEEFHNTMSSVVFWEFLLEVLGRRVHILSHVVKLSIAFTLERLYTFRESYKKTGNRGGLCQHVIVGTRDNLYIVTSGANKGHVKLADGRVLCCVWWYRDC